MSTEYSSAFRMNESLSIIPLRLYLSIYHIFFIYSTLDGHLGCFLSLAIINSAAVNIGWLYLFELVLCFPCIKME